MHNIWEWNNNKKKYQESKCLARPIDRRRRGKEARSNLYVVLVCLGIIFIFFFLTLYAVDAVAATGCVFFHSFLWSHLHICPYIYRYIQLKHVMHVVHAQILINVLWIMLCFSSLHISHAHLTLFFRLSFFSYIEYKMQRNIKFKFYTNKLTHKFARDFFLFIYLY